MTKDERFKASVDQIYTYAGSQYTKWRVAAVKSIRKILVNLDEFYADILYELESENEQKDIVHCQIRNGWFYEAVSQAEQAIEELFATVMNLKDLSFFTKDVLFYAAGTVKKYIWNFAADDLEYLAREFGYPHLSFDDPWDNKEAFEGYKNGVLLTQQFVKELQVFHKKYYDDYCQYKHGMSVALVPMQAPLMKDDTDRRIKLMSNPLEGALQTFHNGTISDYQKRTGTLPAIMLQVKSGTHGHISELHTEGNLLFSTTHVVNIEEVVRAAEHACILLDVLWMNIIKRCEEKETDQMRLLAFPLNSLKRCCVIGFPKEK